MSAEEGAEKSVGQEEHNGADPTKGAVESKPNGPSVETKVEGKETKPPVGKASGGKKKKGKR